MDEGQNTSRAHNDLPHLLHAPTPDTHSHKRTPERMISPASFSAASRLSTTTTASCMRPSSNSRQSGRQAPTPMYMPGKIQLNLLQANEGEMCHPLALVCERERERDESVLVRFGLYLKPPEFTSVN